MTIPGDVALFADDECGPAAPPAPPKPLSADQRRAARRAAALASGIHPVSKRALLPAEQGKKCAGCAYHFSHSRDKTWHKCELNATRGAATDIHIRTDPACVAYEPAEAT